MSWDPVHNNHLSALKGRQNPMLGSSNCSEIELGERQLWD